MMTQELHVMVTWDQLANLHVSWDDVRYRIVHVAGNDAYNPGGPIGDQLFEKALWGVQNAASEYVRHQLFSQSPNNGWVVLIEAVHRVDNKFIPFDKPIVPVTLVNKNQKTCNYVDKLTLQLGGKPQGVPFIPKI